MRELSEITPLQTEILGAVWARDGATAAEVREALRPTTDLARTTVATMLARMERYGWLTRRREGREFTYRAAASRAEVRGEHVDRIVGSLFHRDLPSLVSHALRAGDWEDEDLDRIEAMLETYRRDRRRGAASS